MWDLNRTERRAVAAALIVVGLAGLGRTLLPTPRAEFEVTGVEPSGPGVDEMRRAVALALRREGRAQTPLQDGERIDLNRAGPEELRRLPGVGPRLAEAIVRARDRSPFESVAALERVPGIGPATRQRIEPWARVGPAHEPGLLRSSGSGPTSTGRCGVELLDLNSAVATELQALPGIGPVTARRIVDYRTTNGPFREPAEIERVSGIGPAKLAPLLPRVCVRGG